MVHPGSASLLLLAALGSSAPATAIATEEELVDFEAEGRRVAAEDQRLKAHGHPEATGPVGGLKVILDLLVDHALGQGSFAFSPNHTYVLLQGELGDGITFLAHVSDDPILFEVAWHLGQTWTLRAGKLLVPFGTNEFHHLVGGRVDEASHFLPETWGDYGVAIRHLAWDGALGSVEWEAYAVNGFSGTQAPAIGAGTAADNNLGKGLGARVRGTLGRSVVLTTSAYRDVWDANDEQQVLFYSVGAELRPGLLAVPVLDRLRLRGEWGRGEIQRPGHRFQSGVLDYSTARSGYYAEALLPLWRSLAFRLRTGRINPDNTVTDADDVEVYEPALLWGLGSGLIWTLAYQITTGPGLDWSPWEPADVVYAKFFLRR